MARERYLWTWLRDGLKLPELIHTLHMQRIENSAGLGVPDLEGCWSGSSFWCELKGSNRPAKSTTDISYKLTLEQVIWLENRWKVGGSTSLYLRVGVGQDVRRYLIPGWQAREALELRPESWWEANTVLPLKHKPLDWLRAASQMNKAPS